MTTSPTDGPATRTAPTDGGERLRRLRREFEEAIAPSATSLDGRSFRFEAPPSMSLQVGGYVQVLAGDRPALGQVMHLDLERHPGPEVALDEYRTRVEFSVAAGRGELLAATAPFHDVPIVPARVEDVAASLTMPDEGPVCLDVGEMLHAPGVPAVLNAAGFARHTFMCGQSGSGKSYAMGRLLEELIAHTDLRIVVLDPNSDFVRLTETVHDADPEAAARWHELSPGIRVLRSRNDGDARLRLRFRDLDPRSRAAVLGLDPLADREEYGAFLGLVDREARGVPMEQLMHDVSGSTDPDEVRLRLRIRNLGVMSWESWQGREPGPGLLAVLDEPDWRCLVADLGSVADPSERAMLAAAVLGRLWEHRDDRRPVLVVMDEAHNICPPHPDSPLQRLTTELSVTIAGEGRKYGIYLLVATQRPQKVHENVLSQCDNLVLMRMASEGDLDHLTRVVSCAPASLAARALSFRQGEALVAGRIVQHPTLLRIGRRITQEGGGDVPATWASPS
jgi:DNA helicase HerA-like ATPase